MTNQVTEIRDKTIKISLHIPPKYLQKPIIFDLAVQYKLEVNITSALLGEEGDGDGWFNLKLKGTEETIKEGIKYLIDLGIEVWESDQIGQKPFNEWDFEGWSLEG
ncbi:NIL domain-containing protein [Geminocystis sp. GBBB08]|uniref:NIL domain-containing protein n=1 Tax=Geminocystis sp. GBBB08 TaxID=2604140 RepID=UPI0027E33FAA|nr:NIL domain-containing protein [Geminocystis sp. GBBB08]MBL1208964.1 NIL domain-containing protein [Geminocystis sp. GBBB08]